jgi:ATPase subunit of ABC transporter with duplicated ATPase domains
MEYPMTNPISLTLEGVSFQLPDGSALFDGLDAQFDDRHTGLVGRNGVGKSVLARIMAGELAPHSGRCVRTGSVHYLPQRIASDPNQTVAELAGVRHVIDALNRIERGSTSTEDFELVGERWDIRQQLQQQLALSHLPDLDADTPVARLSGGEAMRVALSGAWLAQADLLILDEPTNHLDSLNRKNLRDRLLQWQAGMIVISHDRELLETMERIVELSALGLRSYGGNYSFYAAASAQERESAVDRLEHHKLERKREQRRLQEHREQQERRQARGNRQAANANQAKILLGRQKERSEVSSGKANARQEAARAELSARVRKAAAQVEAETPIVLYKPEQVRAVPHQVAELEQVVLPNVTGRTAAIDLSLHGAQRVGVTGPNGTGKSTLLKVLAGLSAPAAGRSQVFVKAAYLDQQLATLVADQSILEQLQAVNRGWGESVLRTRLAQLGLGADRILLPSGLLSGGERLKGALACALYADEPAQLLLLDEPGNHLDLAATQALEEMLRQYQGALVVVSHDPVLLANIELTDHLTTTADGWHLQRWPR